MSDVVVPDNYADDVLAHFGKKGMKWGHRKGGVTPNKAAVKSARIDIYKTANKGLFGKGRKGYSVASMLLGTPGMSARVGYELTKAAGYSKGKSLAVGLLAGGPGGMVAAEISARKSK